MESIPCNDWRVWREGRRWDVWNPISTPLVPPFVRRPANPRVGNRHDSPHVRQAEQEWWEDFESVHEKGVGAYYCRRVHP